jgi:hypothetical protein
MNKIDVLPREELAGSEPLTQQRRRSSLKAAKLLLPVWGYSYIRQFLEYGLPTLLAPDNIPAVAAAIPTEFVILTSADDEPFFQENAAFRRLAAVCNTVIQPIDHLITDSNYSTTITLAYTEAIRATGAAMLDTGFFFLVSDYVVADGSLANALRRMQDGVSAVVVGNFQVALEEALPWLRQRLAAGKHALGVPPREMMQWALNHLHPSVLANTVNIPFSHNSHTNRLFWRVDGRTMLGRFYLMHMLCVRPEITDFVIGASCDYSFVPEMCPSGNVEVITDSDEYLVIEMQPRSHETAFLRPGPLRADALAKGLSEWTTEPHRGNARHSVVFHAGDLPSNLEQSVALADAFVADVARRLKRAALPYRGHPYWRGAMVAFCDATGRKLNEDEWRYALGLPIGTDRLSQWLYWQAKSALMGRPPHVLPWHPLWPDFQVVLREIAAFFTDPQQRLLMLSHEPTAFTLALADSGERVSRFRCVPFLQSPPERYKPMHGRFDICLVELSEGDMARGGELIDRLVPLLKDGGRIVVHVTNRRETATAADFANGVVYHGTRFIRAGALPSEIHFVNASRLRWGARRGMLHLRALTGRHPVYAVPAAVVLGGLLLMASFVGNLDALRRSRRTVPRGIASSFVMRLTVDQSRLEACSGDLSTDRAPAVKARERILRRLGLTPLNAAVEQTREPQYDRCLELRDAIGLASLGLIANQVWHDDPRRLGLLLARYKFVAKMLSGRHNVAEVGCGDAFGTRVVQQEVPDITVYDFDPVFIEDIHLRQNERWPLTAAVHDIVDAPLPRKYEALFSLDLIEYISPIDEHSYLSNLRGSLSDDGVLIIGTPAAESQTYASPLNRAAHVNCKSGEGLKRLLETYFARVFLFSMNDEIVHTGFSPMANYLFVVCTGPK